MSLRRLLPTPSTRSFILLAALACLGSPFAAGEPKIAYFADGYHGGVYGHYPPGYTGFLVEQAIAPQTPSHDVLNPVANAHSSGRAGTPSWVMRIGLMRPSSSNSIRSMQVTR